MGLFLFVEHPWITAFCIVSPLGDFFLSLFMISSKEPKKLNKLVFLAIILLDAKMSALI